MHSDCLGRAQLCDLSSLNLSLNGLEDLPMEIEAIRNLESLNLNDNRLKVLPDVVSTLRPTPLAIGLALGLALGPIPTPSALLSPGVHLHDVEAARRVQQCPRGPPRRHALRKMRDE